MNPAQQAFKEKYSHLLDSRPQSEKEVTIRLTRALSQLNIARMSQPSNLSSSTSRVRDEFIYVYCCGTPPFQREAQNLPFKEKCIIIQYTPLKLGQTEEQVKKQPVTYKEWADILNHKINEISTTRSIVLSFHSFGTYIATTYLHFYGSKRIVGMIDLGGLPLRFTPQIKNIIKITQGVSIEELSENKDIIYQLYKAQITEKVKKGDGTVNNNILDNKEQLFAVIKGYKDEYGTVWAYNQFTKWPSVLKCFVYGRSDYLLTEELLSEKVIHYSYRQKWDPIYEKQVSDVYTKLRGRKVQNVQERFIFSIEGGPHIMHMKKKYKQLIQNIIEDYLAVIEDVYSEQLKTN